MDYRVLMKTTGGSILGVIVGTPQAALAKIQKLQDEGRGEISIKTMDGATVELSELAPQSSAPVDD